MNSSEDDTLSSAFWTVSPEQATSTCTLKRFPARLTSEVNPRAASGKAPLRRRLRASPAAAGAAVAGGAVGGGAVARGAVTGGGVAAAAVAGGAVAGGAVTGGAVGFTFAGAEARGVGAAEEPARAGAGLRVVTGALPAFPAF